MRLIKKSDIHLLPFLTTLLIGTFILFTMPTTYAASSHQASISPHVPGCLPWVVAQQTDGPLIVDLEEDNCGGYYTIAFFQDLSYGNFHVYVGAGLSEDGYCRNYQSCVTTYAGSSTNSHHQICFYGEGGKGSAYTNHASGCVTP